MSDAKKKWRIKNLLVDRASVVPSGANQGAHILLWKSAPTVAEQDALPDSAFAWVAPGGSKDIEGRTSPRSNRDFLYKTASGAVDRTYAQLALARLSSADIPQIAKDAVRLTLEDALKTTKDTNVTKSVLGRAKDALVKAWYGSAPLPTVPMTTIAVDARNEFWEEWTEARNAFETSCESIISAGGSGMLPLLRQSCDEFIGLIEQAAGDDSSIPLAMMDATIGAIATPAPCVEKSASLTLLDIKKTLDLVEEQANRPGRSPAPEGEPPMKTLAAILASLPAEDRASIEKEMQDTAARATADVEVKRLAKELEDERAASKLAKEKAEAFEKEFRDSQEKALNKELAAEVGAQHVPGLTLDEAVTLLKGKDAVLVRKVFAAVTVQHKSIAGLMKELGHNGATKPGADSVAAKVETLAKELMATDKNIKHIEVAKAQLYQEDPEIYAALMDEERAARKELSDGIH